MTANLFILTLFICQCLIFTGKAGAQGTFECPTSEGFYPIPGNCGSEYYICVAGSPYIAVCPDGGIFDPAVSACVSADVASCKTTTTTPRTTAPTTASTTTPTTTTTRTTTTTPTTTTTRSTTPTPTTTTTQTTTTTMMTTTTAGPFKCPTGQAGSFPDPNDCTRYYNCLSNGDYTTANCPSGQVFNPDTSFCSSCDEANVDCCPISILL